MKTKSAPVIVGSIYKPPHANNTCFIDALEEVLLHPSTNQCRIILTGDINIDWLKDTPDKTKLINLLTNFKMSQVIHGTTHIGLTSESCIDLMIAQTQLPIICKGIIFNPMHNGISWHNFTYISIKTEPIRAQRTLVYKRNFKNLDEEKFAHAAAEKLSNLNLIDNTSTDDAATELETKINALVDTDAPFKRIRVRATRKPWITNELIELISAKNRLFTNVHNNTNEWAYFKEFRNYVLSRIRQAKKQYYNAMINDSKHNNKWTVINVLTNKHKPTKHIQEIQTAGRTVTTAIDIANALNEFFSCIGATINNDLRQTNNINPLATVALDQNHNGFKFQPITTIDVTNILKTLPNKKKGGIAQVPSFIYKIIGPYIIEPLTVLINKIMYRKYGKKP